MPQPVAASLALESLLTCLEGENEGAISSLSLLGHWFCVKMGFASLIKEVAVLGSTPREWSSAGSMRRLVPGTALASGCWHFPERLLGMGTKSLQSLHLDG